MNLKRFFYEYFNYTTREKYSIIALFIFLIFVFILPKFIYYQASDKWYVDTIKTKKINNILDSLTHLKKNDKQAKLFSFNPNTASKQQLIKLGFYENEISNLLNYRKKGVIFKKKEDFKKLYTINQEDYDRVKNFIVIPKTMNEKKILDNKIYKYNINTLNSYQCNKLNIPYNTSLRIVKYLKTGARFKTIGDIKIIYGITDDIYENIQKSLFVKHVPTQNKKIVKTQLFKFDPNTASYEQLRNLGFSELITNRILKYISKGYSFSQADDLKKIYGLDTLLYNKLEKFIIISNPSVKKININTISLASLLNQKGLRGFISSRLIKYRNILGGFYNKNQYKEVYGINKEEIVFLEKNTLIELNTIKKYNLFTISAKKLSKHPYVNNLNAKKIINYIDNLKIQNIDTSNLQKENDFYNNLIKENIVSDTIINKIKHYLILKK